MLDARPGRTGAEGARGRSQPARRNLRGVTLVELVMVVVILAIMAAVAVPRVARSVSGHRIDAAALRIVGDLRLAQQRARQISASQTVSFDVNSGSYSLTGMAGLDRPAGTYTVRLVDPPYEVQLLSANFGGDALLVFDGWGVPDSGGTVVLQGGDCLKTITVAAGSGKVSVTETVVLPVEPVGTSGDSGKLKVK